MTDFHSNQSSTFVGPPTGHVKVNEWGGRMRVAYSAYTTDDNVLAQNDRIRLNPVPKGARVLGFRFITTGMGSSVTGDVGTTADPDKYLANFDLASAGKGSAVSLTFAETTEEETLWLTLADANPTDTGDVHVLVEYVVD